MTHKEPWWIPIFYPYWRLKRSIVRLLAFCGIKWAKDSVARWKHITFISQRIMWFLQNSLEVESMFNGQWESEFSKGFGVSSDVVVKLPKTWVVEKDKLFPSAHKLSKILDSGINHS